MEEVVRIVEISGNEAACPHDAGAVGAYCSSGYSDEPTGVCATTVAVGTEGVSVSATGGPADRLATVALISAGHGVLPGGALVSSLTPNLRVSGASAANTDNGPGVGPSVSWTNYTERRMKERGYHTQIAGRE